MGRSFPAFQMSFELSLNPSHLPRASLVAQLAPLEKNLPAMRETWVQSLGLGRSPGKGKGYPLQYSGLENSMDCISPWGCKESDTTDQLSLIHFTPLER